MPLLSSKTDPNRKLFNVTEENTSPAELTELPEFSNGAGKQGENTFSVYEHLSELRNRLLWSLGAVIFFTAVSSFYSGDILGILKKAGGLPEKLVYFSPHEGFLIYFKISFFSGLVIASPLIFYEIWMFISPGLYENERKLILPFVFFSSLFFISGVIFSYVTGIPFLIKFLLKFGSEINLSPKLGVDDYLTFILSIGFAFGLIFEWPVFVYFLAEMGIISTFTLIRKRKYAVISVLLISALITPGDVLSMFIFAVPLYLLYETGILITKFVKF
ncbi:MAG: twin-arginine translocase subunit TatC [bacterium]